MPKFGTKNTYFWTKTSKKLCHILNQHHRKFREKTKMPKFWGKMSYLVIFGLEFSKN